MTRRSRNLTASDRSRLIRIASMLPVGSPERKAILAGLTLSSSRYEANVPKNRVRERSEVTGKGWRRIKSGGTKDPCLILEGLGGAPGSFRVAGAAPFIRPAIQHLLSIEDGFGDVSDQTYAPHSNPVKNLTLSVRSQGGIEVRSDVNPDTGIRIEDMAEIKGHLERFFGCKFRMSISSDNRFAYYRQSTDITTRPGIG